MTTLVSFIGNPSKSHSGPAHGTRGPSVAATSEYEATDYLFEDGGFQARSLFFGWAALQHLRWKAERTGKPALQPDRWLVVGTVTSGWQMMAEVAIEADEGTFDRAAAWAERAKSAVLRGGVDNTLLSEFERQFGHPLGTEVRLRSVTDDADAIFGCLYDNLDRGSRVILDVTHSYRTMPIHATLALGALRWIKDIRIADIVYGGWVKRDGVGAPAPAVSLAGSARLAEVTPQLASVALTDDLEAAAECASGLQIGTPGMRDALREASVLDSLLRVDEAESILRSNRLVADEAWTTHDRIGEAAAELLRSAAGVSSRVPRADREFLRAEEFLRRRDYLRAILMLSESIRRRAIDQLALGNRFGVEANQIKMDDAFSALDELPAAPFAPGRLSLLRRTRNQVVHADRPNPDVRAVLADPEKLRRLLSDSVQDARRSLFKHLA
jgi:CRISPR-associated Csx2 family protein